MSKQNKMELKKVIEGCKKQKRKAQGEFFKIFYGKIMGVARRYTDEDDAQDLAQDTFIRAFEYFPTLEMKVINEKTITHWLKGILIKHYTYQGVVDGRFKTKPTDYTENEFLHPVTGEELDVPTDEEIEKRDVQTNDIMWAIDMLDDGKRPVFNLIAIDGYSMVKASEILGLRYSTVQYRYMKAKKLVKFYIGNKELFLKLNKLANVE